MKFKSEISEAVYRSKYMLPIDKNLISPLERIDTVVSKYYPHLKGKCVEYGSKKWVGFAGGLFRSAENPNKNVSAVNCTTLYTPDDTLESIADAWYWWAKFAATGQGEGIDLSSLRPSGAKVHNSSNTSTGPISFMRTFDGILKEIAQEGRRGASLISLSVKHPDVLSFINVKDEEGILETANISIKATDDFMQAVVDDGEWEFFFENEYEAISHRMPARKLFRLIAEHAWKSGDPGLLFWDTSVRYSNSDVLGFPIENVNACFSGDSPILTSDGYVPISTLDGKVVDLINEYGEVVSGKVWKSGKKNTITISFYTREETITCTPDHVFKLIDGTECEAKDLKGKRVMPFIQLRSSNDLYTKLGFIQGDAHLSRLKSVNRHKGFEIYFEQKDLDVVKMFGYEDTFTQKKVYTNEFFEICKSLGFSSENLPTRVLPSTFDEWEESEKMSFMRGLFSANGFVTKGHRVGLKATSLELIQQVSEYLTSIGVENYITTNKEKKQKFYNGSYTMKPSYDLNIHKFDSLIIFGEKIGFVHEYKTNDLKNLINMKSPIANTPKEGGCIDVYDFQLQEGEPWGVVNGRVVHNCSEQVLDGHNVCLLSSINLAKFHEYDMKGFIELIHFMIFVLDAFRREEIEEQRSPSPEQLRKLVEMPRVGLGITGFADMLIRMGVEYGSEESIGVAKEIFSTLTAESYKTSYDIAKNYDKKSFPMYNKEKYKTSSFVRRLLDENLIEDYHLDYQAHVCKTTLAPNGSLSMIVEAGGSGIEPLFAKYFVRRERSTSGDWKNWFTYNDLVKDILEENGKEVTKENVDNLDPKLWVTAHTLDNDKKLKLMAVVQKYIDSAVSVTYNLNEDASVDDIEHIYMEAWKNEAKGVTVYREGSKTGVLITEANFNKTKKETPKDISRIAPKRPKSLPCEIHYTKAKGEEFMILVGILDAIPYELFVANTVDGFRDKEGTIVKNKKGHYSLLNANGENIIFDLSHGAEKEFGMMTRLLSLSLRHQSSSTPVQFIVDALSKDKDFVGFSRSVGRVLKKYIKEGENSLKAKTCPECGSEQLMFKEGCLSCTCGWSKCD